MQNKNLFTGISAFLGWVLFLGVGFSAFVVGSFFPSYEDEVFNSSTFIYLVIAIVILLLIYVLGFHDVEFKSCNKLCLKLFKSEYRNKLKLIKITRKINKNVDISTISDVELKKDIYRYCDEFNFKNLKLHLNKINRYRDLNPKYWLFRQETIKLYLNNLNKLLVIIDKSKYSDNLVTIPKVKAIESNLEFSLLFISKCLDADKNETIINYFNNNTTIIADLNDTIIRLIKEHNELETLLSKTGTEGNRPDYSKNQSKIEELESIKELMKIQ